MQLLSRGGRVSPYMKSQQFSYIFIRHHAIRATGDHYTECLLSVAAPPTLAVREHGQKQKPVVVDFAGFTRPSILVYDDAALIFPPPSHSPCVHTELCKLPSAVAVPVVVELQPAR